MDVDQVDRPISERQMLDVGHYRDDGNPMAPRSLSRALCRAEGDVGRDDRRARSREDFGIHAGSAADRERGPAI